MCSFCSIAESDSIDAESAPDDADMNEVGVAITRFVTRFIDKVCTESNVRADHVKSLHQMIPGRCRNIFTDSCHILCIVTISHAHLLSVSYTHLTLPTKRIV